MKVVGWLQKQIVNIVMVMSAVFIIGGKIVRYYLAMKNNCLFIDAQTPSNTSHPSNNTAAKKEVLTPTLKVEPKTPVIQHLTLAQEEPKPGSPYFSASSTPRKIPLKRTIAFKDPRNECDASSKKLDRVFPTPRVSQVNLNKTPKNKSPESKVSQQQHCTGDARYQISSCQFFIIFYFLSDKILTVH